MLRAGAAARGDAGRGEAGAAAASFPVLAVEEWAGSRPGLVAGVTTRPADFGLSTGGSLAEVTARYEDLAASLGFRSAAVARQVHGSRVRAVDPRGAPGLQIPGEADGLAADRPGVLLVVTVADCVPVYVSDPRSGALALLHAGWRGAAGGVLRSGFRALARLRSVRPEELHVHFGPAICGDCYEVGPEVLARFGRTTDTAGPLDLRGWLAGEALRLGADPGRVSTSSRCTRCDAGRLHSHRASGERAGRMAAFLGRAPG